MVARDQLLKAIEQVESGGRRDAVSPKGARGRMQVMPATAQQPGYRVKPARDQSEEEYTRVGRDYAMALLKNYGGDLEATLVAYNYGPGNANKWIASGRNKSDLPKETRDYITKVSKELGGKNMATKKELTDQRKALQRKVRSGSATDADKRKLKRVQIELGSKGKTTAKAKAPAPKVKRQKTDLGPMSEAARRNALIESVRSIDEDVAGRRPPIAERKMNNMLYNIDEDIAGRRPPAERGMNNMLYNIDEDIAGRQPFASAPQEQRPLTAYEASRKRLANLPQFNNRETGRARAASAKRVSSPGRNPTEAEFMYMIGQQRPDPSMMTPPMRRGVSRKSRPTGPSSPEITEAQFSYTDPGTIPTEDQFRAMRATDIDEDVAGRRGLPSLELMSKAPTPPRSSGGRGDMAAQNKGYETLREYFIEDMTPRRSKVMTPFGIIDIDSTEDAYGTGDEISDMQIEMGQKKGGRLKKKKKPAARKKVAAKKKKVAVKKKPVVRKKAVAKKPPMRKKTVAKKPAGRKRAAKRGFGAELRGN